MYITLQSVSKNLGFKGLEIKDLIIGIPLLLLFIILFCFIKVYFIAISQLLISAFLLLPINVSKKNRMYKVLLLVRKYIFCSREFTYFKN